LPSGHDNFHDDAECIYSDFVDVLRLSVRKSGPAAWQASYAISLIPK